MQVHLGDGLMITAEVDDQKSGSSSEQKKKKETEEEEYVAPEAGDEARQNRIMEMMKRKQAEREARKRAEALGLEFNAGLFDGLTFYSGLHTAFAPLLVFL